MIDEQQRESFAFATRVLGALFYFAPDNAQTAPLANAFQDGTWLAQWPDATPEVAALTEGFAATNDETLPESYQRLFVGPWALPAPPWGSVWLDRENVLFGDSTLALRQWMREKGIAFDVSQNEPEDHFGTLLMLATWLTDSQRYDDCDELLAWHLLPWSSRFLEVFIANAGHPFYAALGKLAQLTLAQARETLLIPVAEKKLYR
ncbi:MAG: Tat proofreading chaperone DmsD [Yokenella regensburgei]|jgi:TorA maturation chaperone TorD|uniref:Tat proofreading chaperone DmsD n=1 Tax=Yokenella regensburgei TaxID=158877 RepID=A0ABX9S244_9ENTR|nr:Tat proofreading chaperone DmsD [Yokenella regensburgei]MDR3104719.1 Tat proofreading chaperone DmsD [Yokenella regensburgei]RKR64546.1 Tat proofreading chaperone DmsD [Yokenella regensburgei]VFS17834.1 Twin-arginine leader-binding protein DmsD [Yokenella regensburgei]